MVPTSVECPQPGAVTQRHRSNVWGPAWLPHGYGEWGGGRGLRNGQKAACWILAESGKNP